MGIRRVYTLDDGSEITAHKLSKVTGVSLSTARIRLSKSNKREEVYVKAALKGQGAFKTYTLSDGSKWTVDQIAKHTGATKSCVGARLFNSREASKVLAPKQQEGKGTQIKITNTIKKRMCFDGREHWLLLAANS